MCGVTFIFDQNADEAELYRQSSAAIARLEHRGPDGQGIARGPGWNMGHRRLAIIDIETSTQPMRDPTNRYCLAYNGEVYNYRELHSALQGRWSFRTNGDTEVVLAGLALDGPEFLDHMEGMWAIAFWDTYEKRLMLVRDRMGQKPLYYRPTNGGIACASELPALKTLSPNDWQEDMDSTADYLRYGYQLPGYTNYKNVREVLPGHVLSWQEGRTTEEKAYWQIPAKPFSGNSEQAAERLREALIRAVDRRMVADVEVGSFLSGGVDSSLITAIVRKELDLPLKTFTIGFEDQSYDERQYAELVADTFTTEHYEEILSSQDEQRLEKLILQHIGQPFADASLLPTTLVSEVAAKQVKVSLSGDGGDELFCGYQRYQARMLMRWYTRLPKSLRNNTEKLVRSIPEPTSHHSRSVIKKAHLFVDAVGRQDAETPYIAPLLLGPDHMHHLTPSMIGLGHSPPRLPETTTPDDLQRMMLADACIYLPQDILAKVDRASMAHSLEARAPFLDRDVVELAFSLPRPWHRRGYKGKRMLQRSMPDFLPASIWQRRKQGFGVPLHTWFSGDLGSRLHEWLNEESGPIESKAVQTLLDEHIAGNRDNGQRLWQIYVYLLWRRASL